MAVTRDMAKQMLALHDPQHLASVLVAAGVRPRGESRQELAHRVVERLWWSYCTPLGYLADRVTLEAIVDHTARRLGRPAVTLGREDPWAKARALTAEVVPGREDAGVRLASRVVARWQMRNLTNCFPRALISTHSPLGANVDRCACCNAMHLACSIGMHAESLTHAPAI